MKELHAVVANCGDGSNSIAWVNDPNVFERMKELAEAGEERWACGHPLAFDTLKFQSDAEMDGFLATNRITLIQISDL